MQKHYNKIADKNLQESRQKLKEIADSLEKVLKEKEG